MANLYYGDDLPDSVFEVGAVVEVTGDEARHAVRVSRLRVGERTMVGNGRGTFGLGEVVSTERDRFAVRIDHAETMPDPQQRLVLVQALAKGDRDERAVEQATEFGVDAIMPWQASRSVSRWDGAAGTEKAAKGVTKWARVAREAAKQSMRVCVPAVHEPVLLSALCDLARSSDAEVVVLHPRGNDSLSGWANSRVAREARDVYLVVGPEGGLSDEEIDVLQQAGSHILTLGSNVLRTSSAGPAALVVLNLALHRW